MGPLEAEAEDLQDTGGNDGRTGPCGLPGSSGGTGLGLGASGLGAEGGALQPAAQPVLLGKRAKKEQRKQQRREQQELLGGGWAGAGPGGSVKAVAVAAPVCTRELGLYAEIKAFERGLKKQKKSDRGRGRGGGGGGGGHLMRDKYPMEG